ncbi:MAG: NrfD/PsrC family molybdoenzyme membrane anchor subunit [Gemmatimonadota bacterium]
MPVVKPPVWTWEVPAYFFVGGLAGMAAVIAMGVTLASPDPVLEGVGSRAALVRSALGVAVAGAVLSPLLLVLDLGRPRRFLNMLRVFKPRSPMSVGAWALVAFTGSAVAALAGVLARPEASGVSIVAAEAVVLAAVVAAGALGALLATYTGVLLAATAVPAWFTHRTLLPLHFGTAGLGSAVAALEWLGHGSAALNALGLAAASVEAGMWLYLDVRRFGKPKRVLARGIPGLAVWTGGFLMGPASGLLRLLGRTGPGGLAFLAGALLSRFAWVAAGRASARDPAAALSAE